MTRQRTKMSPRDLTRFLKELGAEVHTIDDEGRTISRAEALADLIWKRALGYSEKAKDGKETVHPPEMAAIQLIYERVEGRTAVVEAEKTQTPIAERVSDLGRARLNHAADLAIAVSPGPGPVDVSGDGTEGAEGADAEPSV